MESTQQAVTHHLSAAEVTQWVTQVFVRLAVPEEDAQIVAQVLVDADLTGKPTHGVSRLPLYADRVQRGLISAKPALQCETLGSAAATRMDGGNGLGPIVAWRAMERVVAGAKAHGLATVAVHHSNHCGALSAYCTEAARQGMIVLALTNSPPGIAPSGSREAFLGTNPIAWGFPRGRNAPPLVIDLATSVVARGHIIQAARLNQSIPLGWAIDSDGQPTTDPHQALRGAVLPMAGAKGYALALAVEILTGVLSGAGIGSEVKNPYTDNSGPSNVGHFFLALDPAVFGPLTTFLDRMETLEGTIRELPAGLDGPAALPGDRSEAVRAQYLESGIPLDGPLVAELNAWGRRLGLQELTA